MSGKTCPDSLGLKNARVAVITSVPFFLVTQLRSLLVELCARGADVTALTARGHELSQFQWGKGLRHIVVDIRRRPAPWHDLLALVRMCWLFRKHRFAVIHSTTPKAGLLAAVAGWIIRVPVRLHTFTGQQWVTMSGPLRWVSRWSDWLIGRLNTRVYADSPSQRQFLVDQEIVRDDKISVIGIGSVAGVDLQRFDPGRFSAVQRQKLRVELGIADDAVVITFVGRITRDKGINELLTATASLHSGGQRVEVVLVGPLDSALEAGLDATHGVEVRQIESVAGVHAVGYTDTPERYLAITDILCLPSYREGFGTVVIEAAAMAVPTVGTRITGLCDAVVDEETGLLVPPRDAKALEMALRQLIEDKALRVRLGRAARERCLREFDARVVNRRLADEYLRLLEQTGTARSHD